MENNKEKLQARIQELLEHIESKKEELNFIVKKYQELSKNYVPVPYKEKRFWDKIFKRNYKKYYKDYIKSQETSNNISDLFGEIEIIHSEINELESLLYKLEYELSDLTSKEANKNLINIKDNSKETKNIEDENISL